MREKIGRISHAAPYIRDSFGTAARYAISSTYRGVVGFLTSERASGG
ncbi:MAG: hypothetical protein QHG99_09190 [Methanomicrobiales archaeon]|nr:hypothetical protein [Methanomicrobiales archaeon]